MDPGILPFFLRRVFQHLQKPGKLLPGKVPAPPMKGKHFILFGGLYGPFFHIFYFRKGKLFGYVVRRTIVCTGRCLIHDRFVIPEKPGIIQIKIIIPYSVPVTQRIVEGGVQMIIGSSDSDNIPGMAVLDTFLRICFGNGDHTPDPEGIAQHLYGLGYPFTYAHTLPQRTDDFMGIGFFQLIITD